jgi:hypothetical protein
VDILLLARRGKTAHDGGYGSRSPPPYGVHLVLRLPIVTILRHDRGFIAGKPEQGGLSPSQQQCKQREPRCVLQSRMAARTIACDPVQRYVSPGYWLHRQCRSGLHNRAANGVRGGMRRQIREKRGRHRVGRLVWMKR